MCQFQASKSRWAVKWREVIGGTQIENFYFYFYLSGTPKPHLSWLKNGEPVKALTEVRPVTIILLKHEDNFQTFSWHKILIVELYKWIYWIIRVSLLHLSFQDETFLQFHLKYQIDQIRMHFTIWESDKNSNDLVKCQELKMISGWKKQCTFHVQVSSGSVVTSKLKLNGLRRLAEKSRWTLSWQLNDEPIRVDNNQSLVCLTNNNDLTPPLRSEVQLVMNCELRYLKSKVIYPTCPLQCRRSPSPSPTSCASCWPPPTTSSRVSPR